MPRNGAGTMSIMHPILIGAFRSSSAVNQNFADIGDEITNSLPLDGQAGMSGQFKADDGSVSAPGISFDADTNTGFRRSADNETRWVGGGQDRAVMDANGKLKLNGALAVAGEFSATSGKFNPQILAGTGAAKLSLRRRENDALLLHFDGADGSTTFTDSSLTPKTFTANGDAQIDTADSKFSGASGLFDGTDDYITTPDSADFVLGSEDFTIDLWFNCNAPSGAIRHLAGQNGPTSSAANTSFHIQRTVGDNRLGQICHLRKRTMNRLFEKTPTGLLSEVDPAQADQVRQGRRWSHTNIVIDVLWTAEEEAAGDAEQKAAVDQAATAAAANAEAATAKQAMRASAVKKLEALGLSQDEIDALML